MDDNINHAIRSIERCHLPATHYGVSNATPAVANTMKMKTTSVSSKEMTQCLLYQCVRTKIVGRTKELPTYVGARTEISNVSNALVFTMGWHAHPNN